ncbi:MAG: signal peptidase I [Parcubacteria group bacterium]|nr:signal peptidase I [Parcubacteria group bacterium]|tara:strand:- start:1174 stop:1830 length:657 start_codon:yes stop_codon:yes gene_type:complete
MPDMSADLHHDSSSVDEQVKATPEENTHTKPLSSTRSLIFFALIVLIIVLPIRLYVAKPFIVSGTSMFPTFNTWHYLIIDQLTYKFKEPTRGDVVVFRFPQNPSRFFIKRIVGLPLETVELNGNTVTIRNTEFPEGFTLDEPYVDDAYTKESQLVMELGDNEYFVLGDNRKASADSRYWGPLEFERIVGRAYLRLFPFNLVEVLPGETAYTITSNNEK